MPTETEFLTAIAARPDDVAHRLVYADWLDERPQELAYRRAETIRVEEEMRSLPVFSDRFWQLKPRRDELRSRRDPGWLAVMGYADPYRPSFPHGVPKGWKERFRLTRALTEVWLGRPVPDVGGHRDRVAEARKHIGRTLAAAVREWVAFAADVPVEGYPGRLFHTQSGYELHLGTLPGVAGYTIARQGYDGGTLYQLVREADAGRADPPLTLVTGLVDEGVSPPAMHYRVGDHNEFGDRVSSLALREALSWLRGERQFFGHVADAEGEAFLSRMGAECAARVSYLELEVFEAPELLVLLSRTTYPGPGWNVHAKARRLSREGWKRLPAAFREWIETAAKRGRRGLGSLSDAHGFRAAFLAKAGRRAPLSRVALVDR